MSKCVGLVAASAVVALTASAAADDRQVPGLSFERLQAQAGADLELRNFDISAQPLASALNAFGRQAGLQVTIDTALTAGVQAHAVSGRMTAADALGRLLAGTGIISRFSGSRTVVLSKPQSGGPSGTVHLDPVQVQGVGVPSQAMIDNIPAPYAGGQVAVGSQLGLLGNRDVMDTPFNQTSYTAKKAQDQQAQTIRDVLIDDPSVRFSRPTGNNGAQNVSIRGFNVETAADASFNGLYGILPTSSIAAELAERIEVLKGPSAMLNGIAPNGSIGGNVNLVPKRAGAEPLTQATVSYMSDAQFGGHVDVARRFGPDKEFGVRANGVFRAGETAVQWNTNKLGLASLGLDYRGERFRASADVGYQYEYLGGGIGYANILGGVPIPGVSNATNSYLQPWGFAESKDLFGMGRLEFDVTERITLYAAAGAHDGRWLSLWPGDPNVNDINGNSTQNAQFNGSFLTALTGEIGARAAVDTGPIGHEVALSASILSRTNGFASVAGPVYTSNIYNPNVIARPNLATPVVNKTGQSTLSSIAIADTLSAADKRIQLTVGARLQQVRTANYNGVTGLQTASYDKSAISPSVAVAVKPWQGVTVYGNFIQGLQQGTIVGATFANAGQVFPPYKSTQFEAGVKVDWGKLTTTVSAFQITQPSTIIDTASNTLNLDGEQRNRGLEINFFGEPTEGVRLLGGAMFLDAVLVKTAGGRNDGWRATGAPDFQLNLAGEWDVPFARGLTLDSRVIYTGTQYVGLTSPRLSIPDWVRLDVGARYQFDNVRSPTGKPIVIRFNVDNLLDTNYWAAVTYNTRLNIGTPRTFRLSTSFDF
jgi:iron complex outermembrane receptor protein